jgi:hypothetical protein
MDDSSWGLGSVGRLEDAYLKVMTLYMMQAGHDPHDVVIAEMAKLFGEEEERMRNFVEANYAKAKADPMIFPELSAEPEEEEQQDECRELDQMWNGYCPESFMKGKTVRMRLNRWDFFESEATGLQIAVFRGVLAVILNFRGKGEFRHTETYADEIETGELLAPQLTREFPYHGRTIFKNGSEIREYILGIL